MRTPRAALPALILAGAATVSALVAGSATASRPSDRTAVLAKARPHYADWATYHGSGYRGGHATTMPAVKGALRIAKKLTLDGPVYASPLVVHGVIIVATEKDSVYAFDSHYRRLWRRNLGSPSPAQERPCGDINPLGITGTPIYSAQTGEVYLVAEHGGAIRHEMVALSARTGAVKWRKGIDLAGADPKVMQQRGALAISGGRVWAPFGALAGDCGNYKGRVVGLRLKGSGSVVHYDPSTRKQGGIWNPAGGTFDSAGHLFFVSANGSSFPGARYDHTNSVDELNPKGKLIASFAPTDWAQNNQGDVGLGSQGVALVGKFAVLGGKSGPVYVLRRTHLGGIGGQVSVQNICKSFGGAAVNGSVVYLPCTDGVRAVRIDAKGKMHVLWHAATGTTGSPVIGGGRVWALDQKAGVLHALDPRTGKSRAQITVGVTSRFATPALYGKGVYVPTMTGLTVVGSS